MYKQIDSNKTKSYILMAVFIALVIGLGYVYGVMSGRGYDALVFAVIISTGYTAISWFAGDKMTLWSAGAQEITERAHYPYLWNLVENLSITAGLPKPRVYIIQDPSPNAFATGRDPHHASIAVTTGLIERLENEELEGVLAHELSHIGNYDIRWMMLVSVIVGAISIMGDTIFRHGLFSRRGSDRDNPLAGPLMIIGILFIILSPILGRLIQLAISRKREYLADASGALLTRYPEGLARALEKIRDAHIPLTRTTNATAHLWISDPTATSTTFGEKVAGLFSTHPPINTRIQELRNMAHAK